jgi:hypothetical protein
VTHHEGPGHKEIGHEEGQTVGFRVLPDEGKGQWVEVSQRGKGKLFGLDSTNLITYRFMMNPDGSLRGEGQGIHSLSDGSMSAWSATATGTQKSPSGPQAWKVTLHFRNPTGKYTEFATRPVLADFDVAADWTTKAKIFDSK